MNMIGQNIATLRKKNRMTQEALAELIGVSTQSVSKWETGINMPDVMLLPVLADSFGVTVDALYGRDTSNPSCSPDEVLDKGCHAILEIIGQSVYFKESFEQYMAEFERELREDERKRTALIRNHGVVYYRDPLGALLLKRPQNGWQSLLEGTTAIEVLHLLSLPDFRKALAFIMKTHTTVFTIASLCSKCGIANQQRFKEHLNSTDLFAVKMVDLDDEQVTVYELTKEDKLFMLLAVAALCDEYANYERIYYNFNGDPTFYLN